MSKLYFQTKMVKQLGSTKPMRMWIDGKCFDIKRYKQLKKPSTKSTTEETPVKDLTEGTATIETHNFTINQTETGKLATAFRLPPFYYDEIRYFPNFTLKQLETETNTQVTVPKEGNTGCIIVTGNNEPDIVNARDHLQSLVSQIREKQSALQFACIPVHSEEQELLNGDAIEGMDASIFQKSTKLHLTIAVFALMDDNEKQEAITALNACKVEIIKPTLDEFGPLKIKVAGLDCMQDNLAKVNVLYANAQFVHENGADMLQKLANGISDHFYERGLVRQYQDKVKLHVTLINTKYRKASAQSTPKRKSKWQLRKQTFDARKVMEKYKKYDFGESIFDSVHLSYIQSQGKDGFYKPLSIATI